MAGPNGTTPHAVTLHAALEREPYRYDFFQAIRNLECAHPQLPRIGTSQHSSEDPVRFAQEPSLAFAPASVASLTPGKDELPPRLLVHCFGMFGPNGPLPLHLTEYARDRIRNHDDPTFARFVDIFHHRMLSLFYRAWAAAQPAAQHDRPETDRFNLYIGSLFGIGLDSLRDRDSIPDHAKLHHAGHLSSHSRNADGLRSILQDYFQVPVEIDQFVGRWMELPRDCQLRLGESRHTGTLGSTAIVGRSIWECQQKFRIRMGPMGVEQYERLLPGGKGLDRLVAWVRNYIGDELAWDVNLILRKQDAPRLRLGGGARLGYTTWLRSTSDSPRDVGQLYLNPLPQTAG